MRIQNNIMAMNTHRFYTMNNNSVQKSAEKLSSGYRVNRAGDDAAGLAISEKMRAEIRGLTMASKNSQDGVSMVQTAEGALTEVQAMLQRMKELAVQSASDSNENEIDRPALDQEFQQLIKEIDDVAMTTTFNDMKLLDGSFTDKVIQIGSRTGNEMEISIGDMSAAALGLAGGSAGAAGVPVVEGLEMEETAAVKGQQTVTVTDAGAAATALNDGDVLKTTINYTDADGNDKTAVLELTVKSDGTDTSLVTKGGTEIALDAETHAAAAEVAEALAAAAKEDADLSATFKIDGSAAAMKFDAKTAGANTKINSVVVDYAAAGAGQTATLINPADGGDDAADAFESVDLAADYTQGDIFTVGGEQFAFVETQEEAVALGSDVNAVVTGAAAPDADDVTAMAELIEQKTGYAPTVNGTTMEFKAPEGASGSAGEVNLLTQNSSSLAIDKCRDALNQVSTQRAELGAIQNRLEHKIKNLDNTVENVSAAEARIRDVDIAKEMTNFTKNQILSQAATAMLAQANSLPQNVLSLLQ